MTSSDQQHASRRPEPSPWRTHRRVWATTVGLHVVDTGAPEGDPDAPTVVLVHGYPDTHRAWDGVARELAPTMRCVAYDLRGFGQSDKPHPLDAYVVERLVDDLVAVLDDLGASPRRPVHLVAHDWGSVAMWSAVQAEPHDTRLAGRIASYTTISGPGLDHVDRWFRRTAAAARRDRQARRQLIAQARRSWYIGAFQVPVLPGMVMKQAAGKALSAGNKRLRRAFDGTLPDDLDHGTRLYRANAGPRRSADASVARVPVQVVELTRDRYITAPLLAISDEFAADVTHRRLDADHWAPKHHAAELAALVREFVQGR